MKIAITFLLVGLSSTLGTANDILFGGFSGGLETCTGSITAEQVHTLATFAAVLICKYEELKVIGMQNSPKKICLLDQVFTIVKLIADFLDCPVETVVEEVLDCLQMSLSDKRIILEAFRRNDPAIAANVNADMEVLITAVHCTAQKLVAAQGLNFGLILQQLVPTLTTTLGSVLGSVTKTLSTVLKSVSGLLGGLLGIVGGSSGGLFDGVLGGSDGGILGRVLGGLDGIV